MVGDHSPSRVTPRPALPEADPVDVAIERHRARREDLQHAANAVDAAGRASERAEAEADAAFTAAGQADGAAWADLLATRPADVPGAVRLLRYVSVSPASEVLEDPQDLLRQLTEAVEAAEAGGRTPGGSATVEAAAPVDPDPVLAVIEAHRAARETWEPLAKVADTMLQTDPGYPKARAAADTEGEREIAAYNALFLARPTTLSGVLALADYLVAIIPTVNTHTEPGDGDRALATVATALWGFRDVAPAPSSAAMKPDPVLAAIAASRRAEAEMATFQDGLAGSMTPELRAQEEALCEAQRRTRTAVWDTPPTTRAGRLALADYARFQVEIDTGPDGRVGSPRELLADILGVFSAAIAAELPEGASAPVYDPTEPDPSNLDALALIAAIEAEWTAQAGIYGADDEDQAEAGYARRSALLNAADALPADTRDARHAKALALAWIMYADLWRPNLTRDDYTKDGRLALDIAAAFRGTPAVTHPDAPLVAVGPTIAALIAARDAVPPDHEEAYAMIDGLILAEGRRLAAMRARTLTGLILKARFVEKSADEDLRDAIVADLLALGGER